MADIRSMARSLYDPGRFNSGYRAEKRRLREAMTASDAAEGALFGSIAQRSDPTRFGSIAGRFNGLFRPEDGRALSGSSDITAQQMLDDDAELAEQARKRKKGLGLKRKSRFDFEGAEDLLGDDLFGGLF